MEAKVYVGTYGKYNNGNLSGKWISINNCKDYADFLRKCKEAHRDEQDPEYMIQDTENMPDGLDCGEWINETDFTDIKRELSESEDIPAVRIIDYSERAIAIVGNTKQIKDKLKAAGGRFNAKLSCGPGWIFSKKMYDTIQGIINGDNKTQSTPEPRQKNTNADIYKKYLAEYCAEFCKDKSTAEYYQKEYVGAVKLSNGWYLLLEKNRIENRFCFRDEGPDYDYYCELLDDEAKMRRYFISENIGDMEKQLAECKQNPKAFLLVKSPYENRKQCNVCTEEKYNRYDYRDYETYTPTETEAAAIIEAIEYQYGQFKKRLDTYLKKYGVSKLHTWSYWADA